MRFALNCRAEVEDLEYASDGAVCAELSMVEAVELEYNSVTS